MELTIDRLTKQYKNKIAVDRLSFSIEYSLLHNKHIHYQNFH